jgi:chitinase
MGSRPVSLSPADARRLTHINYAFANIRDDQVVLERPYDAERLDTLRALKQYNPDLKVLLSVGGWAWSDHFSDAALTAASRQRFARSAAAIVEQHQLDGLDIDWEYPGQRGEDNVYRPEDKQNFTRLLRALRSQLDSLGSAHDRTNGGRYLLTIAAAVDSTYLANTNMADVQKHLDFVNLMTYDFHGSWTDRTGHHANLHASSLAPPSAPSGHAGVQRFLDAGVPATKLVLGAAFYGRWWTGVSPTDQHGRYQPYETAQSTLPYDSLTAHYIDQNGFTRYWDDAAQAPYLWNAETRAFITYDDPASLRAKAEYAHEHGLGGIMYWEHSHNADGTLLGALHDALR